MELFYAQNITTHTTLSPEESKHCIKVLRHKKGDRIHLIDGTGTLYTAVIVMPDPRGTVVEIVEKKTGFGLVGYDLSVALPPLKKHERYEWFVEKVTEIGVSNIYPVMTRYSERKNLRLDRLKRIIIAASKQSLHTKFPVLHEPILLEQLLTLEFEQKFVGLCDAKSNISAGYSRGHRTLLLIGPEGGFSEEEKQKVLEAGFYPVVLSTSRLRAETAAIVAVGIIANLENN